MVTEIKEGRGVGKDSDHVLLKLDHLGADVINKRLPGIREISIKFANVDPIKEPIPVVPTAHYMMGGIPANYHGQVVAPGVSGAEEVVRGLYAAGECACVSVHGANRLGCNSLLDLLVFGRAAAQQVIDDLRRDQRFEALQPLLFSMGCYVGEVLVRHAGGRWRGTEELGMGLVASSPIAIEMPDGRGCNPVGRVYKRFQKGREDGLASFYQAMTGESPAAP